MSASLVEMIAAIAIAGLIFAGALLPVTDTVHRYQVSETDLQQTTTQHLAALRVRQVAASIWRTGDPPGVHDVLKRATPTRLATTRWELRAGKDRLWQVYRGRKPAAIAQPVRKFALRYLLDTGQWIKTPRSSQLARIVAVRYGWIGPESTAVYVGVAVPGDRAFAGREVRLPKPKAGGKPYRRSDYERTIDLDVKEWK